MDDRTYTDEHGVRRVKDTELVVSVIIGSCALYLGKKPSHDHNTHRWSVYVRGAHDEDLTHIFSKVTFELHHTFSVPVRHLDHQPYEVMEHGWGEFSIKITFHFHGDSAEKPVSVHHFLRLFEAGHTDAINQSTKKPVVSEYLEQLVFSEPSASLYRRATSTMPRPAPPLTVQAHTLPPDEAGELAKLKEARGKVAGWVAELRREFEASRAAA